MTPPAPPAHCAFCGLPLPAGFAVRPSRREEGPQYCCFGCRTVSGVQQADGEEGPAATVLLHLGLAVFFTMNVMVFTVALWSQDLYPTDAFTTPLAETLRSLFRWTSMIFALPVLWLLGEPILQGAGKGIARRAATTDLLILLGVAAAYLYSAVAVIRGSGHIYFEVGSMVLVFVSAGRWLEAKGKRRTGESLERLSRLLPDAVLRRDGQARFRETPREQVKTGDVVRVLPGQRFPVDGVLRQGRADVDQQILTGESEPVVKSAGDSVYSGTVNLDGDVLVEVTAADGRETISRIVTAVRSALEQKSPPELLADRIARWFVPAVLIVAVAAGCRQATLEGVDRAILTSLSVVLIACPCALGLATPMAVWTALGRAAEAGVVFRSGAGLDRLACVRHVCFDKTGTLTSGDLTVDEIVVADPRQRRQLVRLAAAIAPSSTHPLARAVAARFLPARREEPDVAAVTTHAGRGLSCHVSGVGEVLFGSRKLMEEAGFQLPGRLTQQLDAAGDRPQVLLGWNQTIHGAICFTESIRPETEEALDQCRRLGLELRMLTGDEGPRVAQLQTRLLLPGDEEQLPEDKTATVAMLRRRGGVAMVGDGLNDAPALAAADVGVALGCGADVARDAAAVCLLQDDLRRFPWAVELARMCRRIVKQNLFWSFAYNSLGIALAATGRLNPIWAAGAMAASSLLVIGNSLRLSRFPKQSATGAPADHPLTTRPGVALAAIKP